HLVLPSHLLELHGGEAHAAEHGEHEHHHAALVELGNLEALAEVPHEVPNAVPGVVHESWIPANAMLPFVP
ncbi:hypothetical protein, partial [Citrobacter youngae]|uniref:hypothetical protein n=1 Tax=Citrobacter youngae TaxID=133448 RepID=UPI001EF907D2